MATKTAAATTVHAATEPDLKEELRQAEQDFARGDFIELTVEQLDACNAAGAWPWQRESSG